MMFFVMVLLSCLLVLPAFLGVYLLLMPNDHLAIQYMNYRHRRSEFQPLKDEHFGNLKRTVYIFKGFGLLMLSFSVAVGWLVVEKLF